MNINNSFNTTTYNKEFFSSNESSNNTQKERITPTNKTYQVDELKNSDVKNHSMFLIQQKEEDLNTQDKLIKNLISQILEKENHAYNTLPYYPEKLKVAENPYADENMKKAATAGVFAFVNTYHKDESFSFNTTAHIKTPNKSYKLDISLTFSKELSSSKVIDLSIKGNNQIDNFLLIHDTDENPFEGVDTLKLLFHRDEDDSLSNIPFFKESIGKEDEKKNLEVWLENKENIELVSLINLTHGGVYLNEFKTSSDYENNINISI